MQSRKKDKNVVGIDVEAEWYIEAVNEAKKELDNFIYIFNDRKTNKLHFSIKVRFEDDEAIEHLWLTPLSYENGYFVAIIDNTPKNLTNIKFEDTLKVHRNDVEDWIIIESQEKYWGHFIATALRQQNDEI